jgi:hypothetical protein
MSSPHHLVLVINSAQVPGPVNNYLFWPGGQSVFTAVATAWNSATLTLQYLGPDGATPVPAAIGLTANGNQMAYMPAGNYIVAITGGTPTAAVACLDRVAY